MERKARTLLLLLLLLCTSGNLDLGEEGREIELRRRPGMEQDNTGISSMSPHTRDLYRLCQCKGIVIEEKYYAQFLILADST